MFRRDIALAPPARRDPRNRDARLKTLLERMREADLPGGDRLQDLKNQPLFEYTRVIRILEIRFDGKFGSPEHTGHVLVRAAVEHGAMT